VELYFEITKRANIYVIQGNHDVWVKREIREKFGKQKVGEYLSYNTVSIMEQRLTPVDMLHLADWIDSKPYYMELTLDGKLFHIAHAQIYATTQNVLNMEKIYMGDAHYDDFLKGKNESYPGIAIVGHTATEDRRIWKSASGRTIRIDCGNGYQCYHAGGKLAALRLNDMKEFYV
jgi:serine/threonine protein phosphatase 1